MNLAYSSPAGSIDAKPTHPWGEVRYPNMPPQLDGRPYDPTEGKGVQRHADDLIGRRIATFKTLRWSSSRSGNDFHDFSPAAKAGPGPGLCRAGRYSVSSTFSFAVRKVVGNSDGEWRPDIYSVAGSVAPLSEPWPDGYRARLDAACKQRSDMDMWFHAEPKHAYVGAMIVDAVITASLGDGPIGFVLRCVPYLPDISVKPQCQDDVRASVAGIDPRAIVEVKPCFEPASDCLSIDLAKRPERDSLVEDRWTLDVYFTMAGGLVIRKVDVSDTRIIFD